jgi:hypothetical protein
MHHIVWGRLEVFALTVHEADALRNLFDYLLAKLQDLLEPYGIHSYQ